MIKSKLNVDNQKQLLKTSINNIKRNKKMRKYWDVRKHRTYTLSNQSTAHASTHFQINTFKETLFRLKQN